jgi:hypothetical protein
VRSLNKLAESFHSDNLKIALEQLNKIGKVPPRLAVLKNGKVYEISIMGMKRAEALHILKFQFKPDVTNLTALCSRIRLSDNEATTLTDSKQRLFVMTFDHFGGHWVSLFDIHKEGDKIEIKDTAFGCDRISNFSVDIVDSGDFVELVVHPESIPK